MRCSCCNVVLTDFESTRKTTKGVYLDMCNSCLNSAPEDFEGELIEREDLRHDFDYIDESIKEDW